MKKLVYSPDYKEKIVKLRRYLDFHFCKVRSGWDEAIRSRSRRQHIKELCKIQQRLYGNRTAAVVFYAGINVNVAYMFCFLNFQGLRLLHRLFQLRNILSQLRQGFFPRGCFFYETVQVFAEG